MKKLVMTISFLLMIGLVGCGEREGTSKWSDCREKINVKEFSFDKFSKTYTCEIYKTRQGSVMGGVCASIEYDSNGQCKAAFIYHKKQDNVCLDKAFPRLGMDDLCYP